jgi:hypothetical protein
LTIPNTIIRTLLALIAALLLLFHSFRAALSKPVAAGGTFSLSLSAQYGMMLT